MKSQSGSHYWRPQLPFEIAVPRSRRWSWSICTTDSVVAHLSNVARARARDLNVATISIARPEGGLVPMLNWRSIDPHIEAGNGRSRQWICSDLGLLDLSLGRGYESFGPPVGKPSGSRRQTHVLVDGSDPAAHVCRVLGERGDHRAPRMGFEIELEDRLTRRDAKTTLRAATTWGRCTEVFAYDDKTGRSSAIAPKV
ncbi:MAG: AAA-associated domain-containing protein [Bradyrhizobium sp.]|uniref:AAA-associated domain-containing protein n=2 Tax=Bradyrhizobium sp. TaxID=376 RepID=UPI00391CA0F8